MSTERMEELRSWATRQAVEGKPWAEGHLYCADCPWCRNKDGHTLAEAALSVIDAAKALFQPASAAAQNDRLLFERECEDALAALFSAIETFEAAP